MNRDEFNDLHVQESSSRFARLSMDRDDERVRGTLRRTVAEILLWLIKPALIEWLREREKVNERELRAAMRVEVASGILREKGPGGWLDPNRPSPQS
jgi:hypothetical protein